jgi:cysteine desulfuration protein SufE
MELLQDMAEKRIEDLKADFELLDDWEDRYRHVIELGKELLPLDEAAHINTNKVRGCASQVWLVSNVSGAENNPTLHFSGDSDALIVKGLVAIAFIIFSDRTARDILATDAAAILRDLGLDEHLTPQRSNGFASMIERIRSDARAALHVSSAAAGKSGR